MPHTQTSLLSALSTLSPADTLILKICATPDIKVKSESLDWSAEDFSALADKAQETRTGPLIDRAVDFSGGAARKSAEGALKNTAGALTTATQYQTFAFLTQCRSLAKSSRILREAGLRNIALKGFPLAFSHYPHPSLRPLRDLDLLFAPKDALKAQELLLDNGFEPLAGSGIYGLEFGHQLPEIVDSELGIMYEVHHRLNARGWPGDAVLTGKMFAEAPCVKVMGERSRQFPSPC